MNEAADEASSVGVKTTFGRRRLPDLAQLTAISAPHAAPAWPTLSRSSTSLRLAPAQCASRPLAQHSSCAHPGRSLHSRRREAEGSVRRAASASAPRSSSARLRAMQHTRRAASTASTGIQARTAPPATRMNSRRPLTYYQAAAAYHPASREAPKEYDPAQKQNNARV